MHPILRAAAAALALIAIPAQAVAQTRLKDLVEVEGVRENQLVGYGLVVGLNGTGDGLRNSPYTEQSLKGMLERLGVSVRDANLRARNVAAVMVTANLPPFARQGSRIDVTVSSLGDATSLQGGTLVVTPLLGADGQAYAVAQGSLVVGGFTAQGQGAQVTQNTPTQARIPGGAIVEREVGFEFSSLSTIRLFLRNPDFTTARRIETALNRRLGKGSARMLDASTVELRVPKRYAGNQAALVADLESTEIQPDTPARVVVDERSGTVVIGENVRIGKVAVSQGGLTVRVEENPVASQPSPFSDGETVALPRTDATVRQEEGALAVIGEATSLQELVNGLNALGVKPRDVISILQAIKAAGALHADLEVL